MAENQIDYLTEIKNYHRQFAEKLKGKPKGCRNSEIVDLEKTIGFALPIAYKQYLLWMGKDYEGVFVGCDWFITDVKNNHELVPELLRENNVAFTLSEHYLSFFSHQGYMAAWFDLPVNCEDPEVWFYGEGQGLERPIMKGRFTEFLFQDLQGLIACLSSEVK